MIYYIYNSSTVYHYRVHESCTINVAPSGLLLLKSGQRRPTSGKRQCNEAFGCFSVGSDSFRRHAHHKGFVFAVPDSAAQVVCLSYVIYCIETRKMAGDLWLSAQRTRPAGSLSCQAGVSVSLGGLAQCCTRAQRGSASALYE